MSLIEDDNVKIPAWVDYTKEALDEMYAERLGRPTRAANDWDLIWTIEDLLDMAFEKGYELGRLKSPL